MAGTLAIRPEDDRSDSWRGNGMLYLLNVNLVAAGPEPSVLLKLGFGTCVMEKVLGRLFEDCEIGVP